MNNKSHLLENSERLFQEAKSLEDTDKKTAARFFINGHEVLASYYMANDMDEYAQEIEAATALKLNYIKDYNEHVGPETQINYVFLCLSINEIERAKEFCSFEIDYKNSHKFSILLNCLLRRILGIPLLGKEPKYKPTKTEAGLFSALQNVIDNQAIDDIALHKYWRATKSKRYQLTIFENRDLFSQAIKNAANAFNK